MKRCLGLLLLLSTLLVVEPQCTQAFPAKMGEPGWLPARSIQHTAEHGGLGSFWRHRFFRPPPDKGITLGERKGVGARFWGGPYWGYGARLGHPCDACRSTCQGGEKSAYCERCRIRCGW
jgi:hypothetical protein